MALSYPYALDFLSNCLIGPSVPLELRRSDEMSGSGDGRFWSAQLAKPLWTASYGLYAKHAAHAREINAKIYGLDGSQKTFLWCDPYYGGPANGTSGLGSVTLDNVVADRSRIALSGLPAGFQLAAGEFLSISFGTDRVYFGTFCEDATANGSGITPNREIRPFLPMSIDAGASVELVRPYFKAIIPPGGYTPFAKSRFGWGEGASIAVLQKL